MLSRVSEQNVEVIRLGLERYNRRDINGFLEFALHPEIEFDSEKGAEAVRHRFQEIATGFHIELYPLELRDAGDAVLASLRIHTKERGTRPAETYLGLDRLLDA